jgi:aspartyl-tRNA synthetase
MSREFLGIGEIVLIRTHKISQVLRSMIDTEITLGGWVHAIRHIGKLSFVELRDASGIIQLSFVRSVTDDEAMSFVLQLRPEAVIFVRGTVRARPVKKNQGDGGNQLLEVEVKTVKLINQPESLPFEVAADTNIPNNLKLKHRSFYLRRERLQRNIALRSRIFQFVRQWLVERGFLEIETPILFKETVGGAKEFTVLTRNHPGKFYVLRQSPQQLKQILMAGGFEQYFQICKLFHDSYARSQRQIEFTGLDLEAAFASETDIMNLVEEMFCALAPAVDSELCVSRPVPVLTYSECLSRYGSDAPDLRFAIELSALAVDLELVSSSASFEIKAGIKTYLVRIPRRVAEQDEANILRLLLAEGIREISRFAVDIKPGQIKSKTFFPGFPDFKWQSRLTELQPGDVVLFLAAEDSAIKEAVEAVRNEVAKKTDLTRWNSELTFLWIIDQPLFKRDLHTGRWKTKHQLFTAPKEIHEIFEPSLNLDEILGREYALVCNGHELGGGSVRIHQADIQRRLFQLDGLSETEIEFYFGHLLQALESGAPPHAGATFSLDTLVRILAREEHISEVIAFPKLGSGVDPLSGAPTEIKEQTLEAFNIKSGGKNPDS